MNDQKPQAPITVLDLAIHRGAKADVDGGYTQQTIEATGLPFLGGCVRCGATVAAHNASPTTTGYLACTDGCAEGIGYATVEEANRAIFPTAHPDTMPPRNEEED